VVDGVDAGAVPAERDAGAVRVEEVDLVAAQVLGMISRRVFWSALLLPGQEVAAERVWRVLSPAATEGVSTTFPCDLRERAK
jgi:hypothetical protein